MSKQRSFLNLRSGSRGQPSPEPGRIAIEGYRVESLIGAGPLTAVYHAVLESHQQAVVLKILLPHLAESEVFVQRFLQAANAARLVTHDRVLPCYDVGQSNGWVYLACELAEGDSLEALMASEPLERSRAMYLAWQIAMGLEAIHTAGLVHGNLRPTNVLVDSEDGVRLADLGLPAMPDGEPAASPASLHLPPEAILADIAPGPRGDIYALGVVLLGCLHGRTPWSGQSRQALADLHSDGRVVLAQVPAEQIDADLAAVLARATARRLEERYDEIWQLREDLERLQHGFAPIHARSRDETASTSTFRNSGVRSTRTVQEPAVPQPAPGHRWLWPTLGSGAAVLALLAGMVLFRGAGEAPRPPVPAVLTAPIVPVPVVAAVPMPRWASAAGKDEVGRWAVLACNGGTQRLRLVPAGNFWMGSTGDEPGRAADENRHLVTLTHGFWLGETEVTQGFYAAVSGASPAHFQAEDRPVESISWLGVQDFLSKLGVRSGAPARLPSEAEWEYACRAGSDQQVVPGTDRAWTAASGVEGTRPGGRLKANAFGLFDMQGNVQEWVEDTYGRYPRESATDPLATGGVYRVMRGGAWNLEPSASRPAARGKAMDVVAYSYLGFRLAITDG